MKKLILGIIILISAASAAFAQSHEYSPLVEKTVNYKGWTLNNLANNKPTDLRSLMTGKKLVMVLYFAPWCPNWRNEAPVAASLYDKYKSQGFEIIGVSEYGLRDDVKNFFGPNGARRQDCDDVGPDLGEAAVDIKSASVIGTTGPKLSITEPADQRGSPREYS